MTRPKPPSWSVQVALVSHNHLMLAGFKGILQRTQGIQLIGESNGGAYARALIRQMKPDCVIVDIEAEINLIESVVSYKKLSPETRVLLYADWNDMKRARAAIDAGAESIVLKCQPLSVLLAMIKDNEETFLSSMLDFSDIQVVLDSNGTKPQVKKVPVDQISCVNSLTGRERAVIALIAQGLSNRGISDRLSISDITVRHHLTKIFDKLGVGNRQKLLIYAHQLGLVELTSSEHVFQIHSTPA